MDLPRIGENLSEYVGNKDYNKTCLTIEESFSIIVGFFKNSQTGRFIVFGGFVYLGALRKALEDYGFTVDDHIWFKTERYSSTLKEHSTLFTHEVIFNLFKILEFFNCLFKRLCKRISFTSNKRPIYF